MNEEYKIFNLKYTKYYLMTGEIINGKPIKTSIEIKSERNVWHLLISHTYALETREQKIINKEISIENPEVIINELEKINLTHLKNNYFTNKSPEKFKHWELEYNYYFKIVGTFDQEIEEIKQIKTILNCDKLMSEFIEETKKQFNS